jgi:hypothetical protein
MPHAAYSTLYATEVLLIIYIKYLGTSQGYFLSDIPPLMLLKKRFVIDTRWYLPPIDQVSAEGFSIAFFSRFLLSLYVRLPLDIGCLMK